jgi:hypothetical protein
MATKASSMVAEAMPIRLAPTRRQAASSGGPGDQHAEADAGSDQQPDQHIGPEDNDLEAHHEKRIRGSTRV